MKIRFATIISAILSIVIFSIAFNSCKDDEEENRVYPIDADYFLPWILNGVSTTINHSPYSVDPVQESTYPFICTGKDFSKVLILECEVDGVLWDLTKENPQIIDGEWFTIDLNLMEMTVSFKPNDSGKERTLTLGMGASDPVILSAPSPFQFIQAAQEEADSEDAGE